MGIKVRTVFGAHAIYQEIVNYPPKGVYYFGYSSKTKVGNYYQKKKVKEGISRILQRLRLPRMIYIPKINADIIHSSRGILILNKTPWVLDIEHVTSFVGLHEDLWRSSRLPRIIVKKLLESKYCKKIMPHCMASKQSLFDSFSNNKIKDKVEVVYPATHDMKIKNKKSKIIRLLFVSSQFEGKGGFLVLEAFKKLSQRYDNIKLIIKSDVPIIIQKKYSSLNLETHPYLSELLPREKLIPKYYANSDVFIYPSLTDSFGFGILDAMTAGIPVVASDNFAIPEIVDDNRTGFIMGVGGTRKDRNIVMNKYTLRKAIDQIIKKVSILIENPNLRRWMGRNAKREIQKGKFSIKERNKKLKRIYEEALRR